MAACAEDAKERRSIMRPCSGKTRAQRLMTSPHLHAIDARDAHNTAPTATRPIPEIIAELKAGRMAGLVDAEARENEGDRIVARDCVTPDMSNFIAQHG